MQGCSVFSYNFQFSTGGPAKGAKPKNARDVINSPSPSPGEKSWGTPAIRKEAGESTWVRGFALSIGVGIATAGIQINKPFPLLWIGWVPDDEYLPPPPPTIQCIRGVYACCLFLWKGFLSEHLSKEDFLRKLGKVRGSGFSIFDGYPPPPKKRGDSARGWSIHCACNCLTPHLCMWDLHYGYR